MDKSPQKSFEIAYRELADPIFRFVLYRVSSREEALDIAEDAFVRFWETLQKDRVQEPRAFLFKTARNLVIDWYRKKKSVPMKDFGEARTEEPEVFLDMFPGNIPGADVALEAKMIADKIRELEPIYKEVVYLRYVEELTPKEISVILGETTNLISVRINRGLKLLKAKLRI